ncbi:MAG: electron transfer flavoprotein subunit alpha/FixB family protein [Candidatus Aminicenantaceae bacterium]
MILIFIEEREGKVKKSSLEAVSEGKRRAEDLNTELYAVLVGHNLESLASEVFPYGASKVYILESSLLSRYSTAGFAFALNSLVEEIKPEIIFFSAGSMGRDLAPRLAAKMGVSLASDCTGTACKDGKLEVIRPIFAGKVFMTVKFKFSPQIATLRPNVFPLTEPESKEGEVVKKEVVIPEDQVKAQVEEILKEEGAELDVTEAEIVISGGRGIKGSENFDLIRELTSLLPQSAVGASRSAVDAGWIDHQHQVGQTGKTISPNLYMAFGISGAIQHLAGMSSSKYIVAVNKDPDASIFKVADFGIVGDLFQVIPPLKEELKKVLSE